MRGLFVVALLGSLALASASCPNLCSQHGVCGENDRCTCFSNWQGADCSERICPYGLAWVDAPSATDTAHWYAECSNAGVCNRLTGQCECYAGHEGKGCRRSSCPNECSGHGTCYFLEQLKDQDGKFVVDYGSWEGGRRDKKYYSLWDQSKIQGCVCDPYYEGSDCSLRQCPRGDNRLTTGSRTDGVTNAVDQGNTHQEILITSGTGADTNVLTGEFTLTFTDLYGGEWETDPIMVNPGAGAAWDGGSPEYIATRIQEELENLPNQVVESVTVTNIPCGLGLAAAVPSLVGCSAGPPIAANAGMACIKGVADAASPGTEVYDSLAGGSFLGFSSAFITGDHFTSTTYLTSASADFFLGWATGQYAVNGNCLNFDVQFTGDQNAGAQNLLQVNYKGCNYAGCAPQYTGLQDADVDGSATTRLVVYVEDTTEYVTSGSNNKLIHKENAVCSEHGLCDSLTGTCQCFNGYYDEDCNKQTVLV